MLLRTLLLLIALALASCAGGPENLFVPVSATAEGPRFEAPRRRKQVAKLEGKINRAGAGSGPTTRVENTEGERRRNRLRRRSARGRFPQSCGALLDGPP